jgi:hypothetical protein
MSVGRTITPAVRHAALFVHDDLPDPPPGHPFRLVRRPGYAVGLFPGATFGTVAVTELDSVEQAVDDARALLAAEGMGRGVWFAADAALPADLSARLRALGMSPSAEPPFEPFVNAMALATAPEQASSDVEARAARSFDEFVAARTIADDAFEVSDADRAAMTAKNRALWEQELADGAPQRTFVALIDGEVVAFGSSIVGKNATYLSGGGTRADRRGRGAYRALVRARWDTAVERGTPALTVGAGAMSTPILERLGFENVGRIDCLIDRFGPETTES